ncbi:TCR/Tet family MFS transporter [Pseudodonghicola flavimaris]
MMLEAMGVGLILPVMPSLIQDLEGGSLAQAAVWGGVLTTGFAVMQFLFSPTMGNLSDARGRRPVLLISLAVLTLDYLVMAWAQSIWLLLIGRLVGGLTSATQATVTACMADLSRPEEKSANFGLIGAAFGAGFVLGPVIGGVLGDFGPRAPFQAAALLAGVNFLFGLLVLRETLPPERRRRFDWRRANPLRAFHSIARLPGVGPLLAVYLLYSVAIFVYPAIWPYFTEARFGWTPKTVGLSLALFGITVALVQGGLIRLVLRWLGDRGTVIGGLVLNMISMLTIALLNDGWLLLSLTPVAAFGAVVMPALQGLMSRIAPDDAQGELQGVLTAGNALAAIISPLMMTSVFAAFTGATAPLHLPGAPFLVALLLTGVALIVVLQARSGRG